MRYACLIILWVFGTHYALAQNSTQAVFDEANTYYEQGNLAQAMRLYKSIDESGEVSGALYLNMGITAIQLDSMGLAKYYLKKAGQFSATQQQAQEALNYVNLQFSRHSAKLPKLPWDSAVDWLKTELTAYGVFSIGIICMVAGLALLVLSWFSVISSPKKAWIISSFIILGIFILSISFYVDYIDRRFKEGVVITASERVLQNPDSQSGLVSIAYEGYDITIDNKKSNATEGWLYIRLGNGQYGWIKTDGIKIL